MSANVARSYARWLWLLLAVFGFRVVAQPAARLVPGLLPPFQSWHSSALPYSLLLTSQVVIVLVMGWIANSYTVGAVSSRPRLGSLLLGLGSLYFVAMVVRLALGLTVLRDIRWFASPLPTVFHLVLATFVLLVGQFHYRGGAGRSAIGR